MGERMKLPHFTIFFLKKKNLFTDWRSQTSENVINSTEIFQLAFIAYRNVTGLGFFKKYREATVMIRHHAQVQADNKTSPLHANNSHSSY